jgi:hypothetical protein
MNSKMCGEILQISHEYSFYHDEICATIVMQKMGILNYKYYCDAKHFYIIHSYEGNHSIKFFFVIPKHRRTGILTKFVNDLKKDNLTIHIDTNENQMLQALHKFGFKTQRLTHSKKELYLTWKPFK